MCNWKKIAKWYCLDLILSRILCYKKGFGLSINVALPVWKLFIILLVSAIVMEINYSQGDITL